MLLIFDKLSHYFSFWLRASASSVNAATVFRIITAKLKLVQSSGGTMAVVAVTELAEVAEATVFRYGFGRLSHRGKTAIVLISHIISATLKLLQSSGGTMAVVAVTELAEVAEATNVLGMISLNAAMASINSATVFRYGFDRLSHRGKTAIAPIFSIISATLKLVQSSRGCMAVGAVTELAEVVEATNLYGMIFLNSPIALN